MPISIFLSPHVASAPHGRKIDCVPALVHVELIIRKMTECSGSPDYQMCSTNQKPVILIQRCLIEDRLIDATEGWTYHVTCEASDQLGNRAALYDGRAHCIVSDECNQDEQFHTSASSVPHSTADVAPISAELLDNTCSLPSEGINFHDIDIDSFEQACLMEEPPYLTDSHTYDSTQPVENQDNGCNSMQHAPTSNAVDMKASEQLPDDILQFVLGNDQNYFVADNTALIEETLITETQISNKQPAIISLEDNSGHGKDLQENCVDQETNQAINDEVEKYTQESLDHIALTDSPPSETEGKHACGSCDESFPSLLKFRSHQRIKHNKEYVERNSDVDNFDCNRCNRKFSCREHWQSHIQAHTDPDLECPICKKVLGSKASVQAHKKIHERKFSCEFCVKTFETDAQLRSHSVKKHVMHSCKKCEFTCRYPIELEIHLEDTHKIGEHILEKECIPNEGIFDDDKECDRDTPSSSSLSGGNEEDEEVDDDVDYVEIVVVDPTEELEDGVIYYPNDDDVQYNLEVESIELIRGNDSSEELESAYKTVSDIMKSESRNSKSDVKKKLSRDCRKCKKRFNRDFDYKRHSIEHVVQETLRCDRRDADGFHVFQCRLCEGKRFRIVDELKAHLRNHLKMRTYQCNKCPKSFGDSSNYSKHKKVHESAAYQCDTCKRKFHTRKMMKQHMDYHNKTDPLSCSYCDKICYFESALQKHMKRHDKSKSKKSFSCQICYFKFPSMKHKWEHEWKEHGTRKTVNDCSECDTKFRKRSELKLHLQHNHNH